MVQLMNEDRTERFMASMAGPRRALARSAAGRAAILATLALCMIPRLGWAAENPRDAAFLTPMLQQALESARTGVEVPWRNPATGNGGTIVVERTFYREPETPCRAYVRTLESRGAAPQATRGTGCRSSTGLWVVEEEPEALAGAAPGAPPGSAATPPREAEPPDLAEAGPTCPDTVLLPMPAARPPVLAYTLPTRAEL
jgi:surface antigen